MNPITAVSPPEVARPSLETALPSDPGDPTVPMAMHIEITRIQPYPRNPRRVRNAEYEAIKASIRVNGMTQPLVVTRIPADAGMRQ